MKNFFIALISFLFFSSSINFIIVSKSLGHPLKSVIAINDISQKISKIHAYHVLLKTKIYPPDISDVDPSKKEEFDPTKFMEFNTTVFGESGRKMKIVTTLSPPEKKMEIDMMLLFDGKWLWVEQKVKKHPKMQIDKPIVSAMKIHIPDVSPDPEKEPFSTIYGVSGTGLFRYRDLPGTFTEILNAYNLHPINVAEISNEIIFGGKRNQGEDRSKLKSTSKKEDDLKKELSDFLKRSTQYCKIWVSNETNLIMAYSLGKSNKRPYLHTKIEYISFNKRLPDDIFIYKAPNGIEVHDKTSSILQRMKQNIKK